MNRRNSSSREFDEMVAAYFAAVGSPKRRTGTIKQERRQRGQEGRHGKGRGRKTQSGEK